MISVASDGMQRRCVDGAILSISAGAVHVAASGSHHDLGVLGILLAVAGVGQLALGAFVLDRPEPRRMRAVAVFNCIAVLAWAVSRTIGLPLQGAAGAIQSPGVQDVTAAVLGAGAVVVALGAPRRSPGERALTARSPVLAVFGLVLVGIAAPHHHDTVEQAVPILEAGHLSDRLPPDEGIALLGLSARAPMPGSTPDNHSHDGHHGTGFSEPRPARALNRAELSAFEQQWSRAVLAAEALATADDAIAAGYTQASTEALGVGSHWVKWSFVDMPFDPAKPSMLLFKETRHDQPPELVGFSYYVASPDEPAGFAGPNDIWHRHHGMCFVDGWLRSENVALRGDCPDTWIDGRDLWMLHAWTASGWSNSRGLFADMNPSLCGRRPLTPDILSCDPAGL